MTAHLRGDPSIRPGAAAWRILRLVVGVPLGLVIGLVGGLLVGPLLVAAVLGMADLAGPAVALLPGGLHVLLRAAPDGIAEPVVRSLIWAAGPLVPVAVLVWIRRGWVERGVRTRSTGPRG